MRLPTLLTALVFTVFKSVPLPQETSQLALNAYQFRGAG